ncbi:IclR family transcriptional regulator [Cytobacillus firmus]|uniref:Glycerol operon regulatory protein n=2 Tax=Cytobacillus TaxID=2675230 RepID=A0A366JH18_CYTFI|nr:MULTISPECIES: IclR family transcriptional regulator [Cytobacillus]RBP86101.1 IclR family transcriptional regulator [Cytobacillus firmus]TDX35445.1 IclR family transcriptional regulator [Cytobacillus oceanisediminis]
MSSKTVSKALSILDVFTPDRPAWGLRDIARELEMSHTIVHRLLKTFEEEGYIFQNPETHKYELGIKFIQLSNTVEERLRISDLINPIMKNISVETGESVVFTVIDNEEGLFVKIVESEHQVRFAESVGKRGPLYIGASHKVILAHLPDEVQNRIINQGILDNAPQLVSKKPFLETMEFIRQQGWFYTAGETLNDAAAISVPVFDPKKNVLGSISVAGPSYRFTKEQAEKVLPVLNDYIDKIDNIFSKVFFPSRRDYLLKNIT